MIREEAKSCICTIKMLQRLAYNIHGVMDVIDADNCKKIIKALEQEPCEDCISRQAVLDMLENINAETEGVGFYYEHYVEYIKNLSPVTPQQNVGKWTIHPNGVYAHLVCSKCLTNAPYDCKTKYCPNCGAKMEEEEC